MTEVFHLDYFGDLLKVEKEMTTKQFEEFNMCIDKALYEIRMNPLDEGAPCQYPTLIGYRKKKFHSVLRPAKNVRANCRIVYRYDNVTESLYVLGVGIRKPGEPEDVWKALNRRDQKP